MLFRTINLVLFTLVKITHPDASREGLMSALMERRVCRLRWMLMRDFASTSPFHIFGFCVYVFYLLCFAFFPSCSFFLKLTLTSWPLCLCVSLFLTFFFHLCLPSSTLKHTSSNYSSCFPLSCTLPFTLFRTPILFHFLALSILLLLVDGFP